jgi:hypothetical protein
LLGVILTLSVAKRKDLLNNQAQILRRKKRSSELAASPALGAGLNEVKG